MEAADLLPLLDQLDDNVDDLEEALGAVLNSAVTETSKKLPVLDKAKFHVLVTYALESLIFCFLRLHGVNAKDHPVFRELTRVKQYFEKIKALETEPEQRTMTLDKEAAGRFIKHGLAGNDKFDLERKEALAKEKARAQFKASILAKKEAASEKSKNDNGESGASKSSENDTDEKPAQSEGSKKKKGKGKTAEEKADKKKKRHSKEGRTEDNKERKKKKKELRKSREA